MLGWALFIVTLLIAGTLYIFHLSTLLEQQAPLISTSVKQVRKNSFSLLQLHLPMRDKAVHQQEH